MKNKTLVILDLKKNYDLYEKDLTFISLNKGVINLDNCKQLFLKDFPQIKKEVHKKLISKLQKIIYENKNNDNSLIELEVNNLRNDRYDFIDRITNLVIIKKIILSSGFKKLKIISDNKNTLDIFDKLNIDIEKKDFSKKEKKLNFLKLKLPKFYLKSFFIVIFLKLKKKDIKKKILKHIFQ